MKQQVDMLNTNSQRGAKDVAVLYKRFLIHSEENVMP